MTNAVAFVRDGVMNGAQLRPALLHQPDGVPAYREMVGVSLNGNELHLTRRRQGWPNTSTTDDLALRDAHLGAADVRHQCHPNRDDDVRPGGVSGEEV